MGFQRSRTPEQREQRREHILATARDMLAEARAADIALNEIARRADLAKSNVLNYFDSREAILLELTKREYTEWVDRMLCDAPSTPHELAQVIARTAIRQTHLGELLSTLMNTLEHNVTADTIIEFKVAIHEQIARVEEVVEGCVGKLSEQRRRAVAPGIHALIVEYHLLAHPAPALREAAARDPRIRCGLDDHEGDLRAAVGIFLGGLRLENQWT